MKKYITLNNFQEKLLKEVAGDFVEMIADINDSFLQNDPMVIVQTKTKYKTIFYHGDALKITFKDGDEQGKIKINLSINYNKDFIKLMEKINKEPERETRQLSQFEKETL